MSEAETEALESHYLTCARCQSELRLAAAIREVLPEVPATRPASVLSPATAGGRRFGRQVRIAAAAGAIAAALAGILLLQPPDVERPQHREPVSESEAVPTLETPVGEVGALEVFRWAPVTAADLYRVTLYDDAGNVVWELETRETGFTLPDSVQLETGTLYLWQVDARVDWDRWVSSELVRFRVSEP